MYTCTNVLLHILLTKYRYMNASKYNLFTANHNNRNDKATKQKSTCHPSSLTNRLSFPFPSHRIMSPMTDPTRV